MVFDRLVNKFPYEERKYFYCLVGFLIFLFVLFGYRASLPHHWSKWIWGDTQTMMAVEHFNGDGFFKLHFLWVPQGYSNVSHLLDDNELRHHAHGSIGTWSGLGPKRLYTHWPSWYSVPYGVLRKMGIQNKSIYQCFASLLSVASLIFLYLTLACILSQRVALFSVVFYGLSPFFINYADSLATMPHDDLFRFAFIFSWVRIRRSPRKQKLLLPLGLFFLGTSTTLDFIPWAGAFVVGYDVLIFKKWEWKTWLTLLIPFSCSVFIQFLQNASYLGFMGTLKDWGAYFYHNSIFNSVVWYEPYFDLLKDVTSLYPWQLLLLFIALYLVFKGASAPYFLILMVFLLAGTAFPILLPNKTILTPYQGRQLTPFFSLLCAILMERGLTFIRRYSLSPLNHYVTTPVILILLFCHTYKWSYRRVRDTLNIPPNAPMKEEIIELWKDLSHQYPKNRVYFQLGDPLRVGLLSWGKHHQPLPWYEYYSGGLLLCFSSVEELMRDLFTLWVKKSDPFVPILIFSEDSRQELDKALLKTAFDPKQFLSTLASIYVISPPK